VVRIDDEIVLGHRSETEAMARYFAKVFRQDHRRTGCADVPAPRFEDRAVDAPKRFTCPNCQREAEAPREEPWVIHGRRQHAAVLVAFDCPHCDDEIRLT
jgi:predicted RNA-binding Zn-ribbon protein involved in translation (DUF1610 family)